MEKMTKNFEETRQPSGIKPVDFKRNARQYPECLCMIELSEPIYQCESGHNMCSKCTKETPVCPICRKPTGKMRNWQLEEIVAYYRAEDKLKEMETLQHILYNECQKKRDS
ncbi:E3 ubiquitin-protein ligase sina-like [Spodoptera litura]|uniref:E3 ubiquitin-protein ligase sina-like n=1 Tax=Spodoptera litura TaxID=69820 RepID=A0A9J7IY26_SPOLT|nr:E3 ubiquitin-protein ligase sina-like [Spodoptera litura]